jgi:hypothetical protein
MSIIPKYSWCLLDVAGLRPSSEILSTPQSLGSGESQDAMDAYYHQIERSERMLEEMRTAQLDDAFKEELRAIEEWFKVLSESERTTSLYALLKYLNPNQIRFFITILNAMAKRNEGGAVTDLAQGLKVDQRPSSFGGEADLQFYHDLMAEKRALQQQRSSFGSFPINPNRNSVGAATSSSLRNRYVDHLAFEVDSLTLSSSNDPASQHGFLNPNRHSTVSLSNELGILSSSPKEPNLSSKAVHRPSSFGEAPDFYSSTSSNPWAPSSAEYDGLAAAAPQRSHSPAPLRHASHRPTSRPASPLHLRSSSPRPPSGLNPNVYYPLPRSAGPHGSISPSASPLLQPGHLGTTPVPDRLPLRTSGRYETTRIRVASPARTIQNSPLAHGASLARPNSRNHLNSQFSSSAQGQDTNPSINSTTGSPNLEKVKLSEGTDFALLEGTFPLCISTEAERSSFLSRHCTLC